ncbi:DUF6783 domain-containing protein [Lacrimispora sp.]
MTCVIPPRAARVCLKTHCSNLYLPLRSIFAPNSVGVAHYAAFI